ncbi:MAG TPA: hypothetical protein VK827_07795, partial [Lysobacter sp.]|nr:hypothetical protein [Lysobacter sp.]
MRTPRVERTPDQARRCAGGKRAQFHDALKHIVGAGFEKRILYGSDQMYWPDAITDSIDAIQSASFL